MGLAAVGDPVRNAQVRENYLRVVDSIHAAATRAARDPAEIKLVVVSKLQPVDAIRAAIAAGARIFGENYAEQAAPKVIELSDEPEIEWHMIGHVQSRKAGLVCQHFSMIHSLDSLKLAEKMETILSEQGKILPALLEFNLGGEESKHGWDAANPSAWESFLPEIERILRLPHLKVKGCMTMPPYAEDPEESRPYFQRLRDLKEYLSAHFKETSLSELSMGTSADYPVAIEEGATLVRVGRAILGDRPVQIPSI